MITTKSFTVHYKEMKGGKEYTVSHFNFTKTPIDVYKFAEENAEDIDRTFYEVELMKEDD